MATRKFSRRQALHGAAGVAAAATGAGVLAGCSREGKPGANGSGAGEAVTLSVAYVPDAEGAEPFYRDQFAAFMDANPSIKIEATSMPAQVASALQLMFQQGNAPDVFRLQGAAPVSLFAGKGWLAPLDDFVTDDFTSRFPDGALNPKLSGLHVGDTMYSLPLVWGKWTVNGLFLCNMELLRASGFSAPPTTWGELETMATKITQDQAGKAYGFAPMNGSLGGYSWLQATGGPYSIGSYGVDLRDGRPKPTDPSLVEAIDLYRRLASAKVMSPGWEGWTGDQRPFTEFAKGKLAMYIGGSYHVNVIRGLNPDIEIAVATVPVPDEGRGGYLGQTASFTPIWSMSSESKHPEESWKLLDFLASEAFQTAYFEKFRSLTAIETVWRDRSDLTEDQKAIIKAHDAQSRPVPAPDVSGSDDIKTVLADLRRDEDLKLSDMAAKAVTKDQSPATLAAELETKMSAFLSDAFAKTPGASAKDLTFSDWDPLKAWQPA